MLRHQKRVLASQACHSHRSKSIFLEPPPRIQRSVSDSDLAMQSEQLQEQLNEYMPEKLKKKLHKWGFKMYTSSDSNISKSKLGTSEKSDDFHLPPISQTPVIPKITIDHAETKSTELNNTSTQPITISAEDSETDSEDQVCRASPEIRPSSRGGSNSHLQAARLRKLSRSMSDLDQMYRLLNSDGHKQ